jgi:hypothetical protein
MQHVVAVLFALTEELPPDQKERIDEWLATGTSVFGTRRCGSGNR